VDGDGDARQRGERGELARGSAEVPRVELDDDEALSVGDAPLLGDD
jgi:hypothetical protein